MLTLEQAQQKIIAGIRPATLKETVELAEANGRYLAATVIAKVGNPVFDNSAMDGYALNTADIIGDRPVLPLQGESSCGSAPSKLASGTTMRIFTGAPVPEGADAVVIQEDIKREGDTIVLPHSIQAGQNIRRRGEDFHQGDKLYERGRRLHPYDIALLATAGLAEVSVYRRARVLVVATGDELVSPGTPLRPGQIYESNRLATLLQLRNLGIETVDGGTVKDDITALRDMLADSGGYDFVITSGGVSVGDHDLVKQVFAEIGEINFWKAKIKPGKPVAFGHIGERTHFFGLPGNPVSSLVTFKLFVEPALIAWHHCMPQNLILQAKAANDFHRHPGRTQFLRARLFTENGQLLAQVLPGQGSHMVASLRDTNGFIRLEETQSAIRVGDPISVIPLIIGD